MARSAMLMEGVVSKMSREELGWLSFLFLLFRLAGDVVPTMEVDSGVAVMSMVLRRVFGDGKAGSVAL